MDRRNMDRRTFLQRAGAAAVLTRAARAQTADLEEITIADLARMSARQAVEGYLARIRDIDPKLRSVVEVNPDALSIADELDRGPKRGPLHGVPVLIKDNIDTADRMKTTAGSLALMDAPQPRDAAVVERLRAAGAVILGKTNLSEWANFRSTHSMSGWSGRGGQTRNPYALDRSPCGSSSGSGAAAAANLCAVAVGTETDGSVVCPSSINGIVGIKPTLGLIGGRGIVPIAHSQDTAGPMARTVRDAAILLGAMAEGPHAEADYTKFLDAGGLRGARLGVARKFFGITADVDRLMESSLDAMKKLGAEIVDPADLPSHGKYGDPELEVLLYEFKNDLNGYLETRHTGLSLERLIAFNNQHRGEEMPYFEQEIFEKAQKKGPLSDPAYRKALAQNHRLSRAEGIDAALKRQRLDAIVAPTAGPAWLIDNVNGDHDTGGCSTPAAVAGYPHITVPAGFVRGLPVGISFFGTAWSEPALLKLAYAFEQATKARKKPEAI
ncbi:Amidase [Candidatus Sulfopaludibacter sp. SbA4]|nr:Amidase [Candidatus Sulfopaludibacter sp. SbA4]